MKRVNFIPHVSLAMAVSFLSLQPAGANAQSVIDFDGVDASAAEVDATGYLAANGVTLSGVTPGSHVNITSDQQFYNTPGIVFAASGHNFLLQNGLNTQQSFTLIFSTPLTSLSFTRITETGGPTFGGNSFAPWTAEAFQGTTQIGQYGESGYSIFGPQNIHSAQVYTFTGTGITSVQFDGNDQNFYGTSSVLLDNLTLTPVPEPTTLALCGLGILGALAMRRRSKSC